MHGAHPDFMMTMSPQIRRHPDLDVNADETTLDHTGTRATFTNPPTNYHSHAKISNGRNGHKKGSVDEQRVNTLEFYGNSDRMEHKKQSMSI